MKTQREKFKALCDEEALDLVRRGQLTFIARDLGYPDHTMIHEAAVRILANHVAKLIIQERYPDGNWPNSVR